MIAMSNPTIGHNYGQVHPNSKEHNEQHGRDSTFDQAFEEGFECGVREALAGRATDASDEEG